MGLPSRFEGLVMKINIYGYFMQYLEWFLTFSKASIEYLVKKTTFTAHRMEFFEPVCNLF